jgi:hypothetical protein
LLAPNLPAHKLTEQTGEHHTPCKTPLSTPWEHKPAHPLGRLIPFPNKTEKQTVNCNQTWTVEGAGGTLNLHQRKGAGQETKLSAERSVNKHRKGSKD